MLASSLLVAFGSIQAAQAYVDLRAVAGSIGATADGVKGIDERLTQPLPRRCTRSDDQVDRALVQRHLDEAEFFWLDLHKPSPDEIAMLDELFALHPLAVEDVSHFGQRPKLDDYDDVALLVAYGANADSDGLVEVHCFLSARYLITVHHDDCPSFEELRRRAAREPAFLSAERPSSSRRHRRSGRQLLPELTRLDDRIDDVEAAMLQKPTDEQLQEIFHLKRRLVGWRKVITAQRDLFAGLVAGVIELPGMRVETDPTTATSTTT